MAWQIDTAHAEIQFAIKHMMVATVRGRFTRFDGTVNLDERNPAASTVSVQIDAASIDTNQETRDNHLRLGGHYESFFVDTLPPYLPNRFSGPPLGQTYKNCAFWAPSVAPVASDDLFEAEEKLPVKKLVGLKRGKSLRVSADFELPYWDTWKDNEHDGENDTVWNATIKRLK